jgi:hypothetical protein
MSPLSEFAVSATRRSPRFLLDEGWGRMQAVGWGTTVFHPLEMSTPGRFETTRYRPAAHLYIRVIRRIARLAHVKLKCHSTSVMATTENIGQYVA